jgi:hypothetical protein
VRQETIEREEFSYRRRRRRCDEKKRRDQECKNSVHLA